MSISMVLMFGFFGGVAFAAFVMAVIALSKK